MLINTKDFKDICSKILLATSKSELDDLTSALELKIVEDHLELSTTNNEYYVNIKFPLSPDVVSTFPNFHATVNASKFLKLASQITTEDIELDCKDKYLEIKANGKYKIPYIFEGDNIMSLPIIKIDNVTSSFDISNDIISSIHIYNSKNIAKDSYSQTVQKMYYLDDQGCITFDAGACINQFKLEKPIKLLLKDNIVKLFKLFNNNVHFQLGFDALPNGIIQTKISLKDDTTLLSAVVSYDDSLMNSVPSQILRERATFNYPNTVVLNKDALLQSLNRLSVFSPKKLAYGILNFTADKLMLSDCKKDNTEYLNYQNGSNLTSDYELVLSLDKLKTTLSNFDEEYITLSFGNSQALVVKRNNILNVLPECKLTNGE